MLQNLPKMIYLKDYKPKAYGVDSIELIFDLHDTETHVHATIQFHRNTSTEEPLVLYGNKLDLKSIRIDGRSLSEKDYTLTPETLTIAEVPQSFILDIENTLRPKTNTELSGLYQSGSLFCTQCEPEGFRNITYYPDRPDVMTTFKTTLIANKKSHPVLLSNGNCIAKGDATDTARHFATWMDPFKKPSYLFALVAGDLISVEDFFVTRSGRLVTLKLFIEHVNLEKSGYALQALKKAMKWDEEVYGREYDLDIYMIVAVNDFNMGAMENKGLNIFNAKYVLASPETATDLDYYLIDAVVGHEYFHNWSGNRVTCRDWFQLSLKEGLTVFREHHFSSDITQSPVSLIENAQLIRSRQFPEDAGPMAHPVRPDAYLEINNFYTVTIYEKGAEVIRMIKTLLGWDTFRKGMDVYFERHDGEAVTTEDFVCAMEFASDRDLTQFRLWYTQAGTPVIHVAEEYNPDTQCYVLTLSQSTDFHIPIAIGLLGSDGKDLLPITTVLELKEKTQRFEFYHIRTRPILSILRSFSAPVKIKPFLSHAQLAFLLAHDSDDFNRWDAAQQLTEHVLLALIDAHQKGIALSRDLIHPTWLEAYRALLLNTQAHPALKAEMLCFPSVNELIEKMEIADVVAIHIARSFLKHVFAEDLSQPLLALYQQHNKKERYRYHTEDAAHRRLKNICLYYLSSVETAVHQFQQSNNMTDTMGALSAVVQKACAERTELLASFYERFSHEPLVVNKWLSLQATSELPGTLEVVQSLLKHPNKVYALIGGFANNPVCFHEPSGAGYAFIREMIIQIDASNPQVAARLMTPFTRWKKFDLNAQALMRAELECIEASPHLSKDIREIVTKLLAC